MKLRQTKKVLRSHHSFWRPHRLYDAAQRAIARYYRNHTEELRAKIEQPKDVKFWGQPYTITPRLVSKCLGDGLQLIYLKPLSTRPDYYIARIDSRHGLSNHSETNSPDDWLDDLYNLIEDEFGRYDFECDDCGEDGKSISECGCQSEREFPALDLNCGSSWGTYKWPA